MDQTDRRVATALCPVHISFIYQRLGLANVGIPLVLVSVTARALVTTPMVEYSFLMSVERDRSLKGRNEP